MSYKIYDKQLNSENIQYREAVRGVVLTDGGVILEEYKKFDFFSLPGGGIEKNESPQAAFIREIEEETGLLCDIVSELPIINENRSDDQYVQKDFNFLDKVTKYTQQNLDKKERENQLTIQVLPIFEVLKIICEQPINTE